MKKSQRTELLERSARIALDNALRADRKLAEAIEADGGVHVSSFITLDRHRKIVRRMRAEHERQLTEYMLFMANPPESVKRLAELVVNIKRDEPYRRREQLYVVRGDKEEQSRHEAAAEAILRSGRRRRNEED